MRFISFQASAENINGLKKKTKKKEKHILKMFRCWQHSFLLIRQASQNKDQFFAFGYFASKGGDLTSPYETVLNILQFHSPAVNNHHYLIFVLLHGRCFGEEACVVWCSQTRNKIAKFWCLYNSCISRCLWNSPDIEKFQES